MSHFAQINNQYIVQQVLVITQEEVNTGNWGDPANWFQTSYNTRGGIYYIPNTNTPDPDQSKAFRKNYAGIGYTYLANGPEGEGFAPPFPYPSWVMDSFSYQWKAPVPMPVPNSPPYYQWDEATVSWVVDPNSVTTGSGGVPNVIG
jgi:hypothetical protein